MLECEILYSVLRE